MKCLLCNQQFSQEGQLKQHYINFHKAYSSNNFFIRLFKTTKQTIICQKQLRCDDVLTTNKHKVLPNFLKHYSDGKRKPFEERPIDIKKSGNIMNYKITVGSHGKFYNFSNSEEAVNDFLNNVTSKFNASGSVMIKFGFSMENIQPAPSEYNVPILNVRH